MSTPEARARIVDSVGQAPKVPRHCLLPACEASFDIVAVFSGVDAANGWRLLSFFGAVYLCPAHAGPCVSGRHLPSWLDRSAAVGMTGIGCACGWKWRPSAPSTMGDHRDEWVAHLADEIAALAAGEGN